MFSLRKTGWLLLWMAPVACQGPQEAGPVPPAVSLSAAPATASRHRPIDVAWGYYGRLIAGDAEGAEARVARFAGFDPAPLRERIARESADLRKGFDDFHIEEEKIDGDIAVAVYVQTQETIKPVFFVAPIYLIRQEGEWKILPTFNRFDAPEFGFDAGRRKRFAALSDWFSLRKEELRADHRRKIREADR